MSDINQIKNFVNHKKHVLFGVSRSGKKFGNSVLKELSHKGYEITVIHPDVNEIDGFKCFPDIYSLPEEVKSAIMILPPAKVAALLPDLKKAGIEQIWLQQGAESEQALKYCSENGIDLIHNECILMFAEPVGSFHKFHGWINKVFGKYPVARSESAIH